MAAIQRPRLIKTPRIKRRPKVTSAAQQGVLNTAHVVSKAQQTARSVQGAVSGAALEVIALGEIALGTSTTTGKRLLEAVRYGHDMWRLQAHFQDLRIMAVSAIGVPGCLRGPDLAPLIGGAPGAAAAQGLEAELREAVAEGVAECFRQWQDQVSVPGLPWYPAFAAFPGPQAPPIPNVPMPLISCPSAKASMITTPAPLRGEMYEALPDALQVPAIDAFLNRIAQSLAVYFLIWLAQQQVMLVMGKGPIPTFAPPYVPVGPVVGGDIIAAPGHLIAGSLPNVTLLPG